MRVRLRSAVALLLLLVAPATPAVELGDAHGIAVVAVDQLTPRQLNARVATAALEQPVDVRILVPEDYDDGDARYPVLYLFHGTSGRASDWIVAGDAEAATAGLPLIVVMPDIGFDGDGGGWFADWWNGGARGQPMWETFHVRQLIPWVDANLRTVAARDGRALAGLSQGGFGSLSYAARHPDLFTSAAAFSGACQIDRDAEAIETATFVIQFTTGVLSGKDPDAVFGPRATASLNWQAHDPATLVTNLRGLHIALWTGNGEAGPLDPLPLDPAAVAIERATYGATRLFHGHLDDERIAHHYVDYGGGTHIWPYWARDLREYLPLLMARFAAPPRAPRAINYLSADDEWEHWGWRVRVNRPAPGFSHLQWASRRGFALTGSGDAVVRTPSLWAPGTRLRVSRRGAGVATHTVVRVGDDGRAEVDVPLSDGEARTVRVRLRAAPLR